MKASRNNATDPPKWVFLLLQRYCHPLLYEGISGDLMEIYQYKRERKGKGAALYSLLSTAAAMLLKPNLHNRNRYPRSNNITMVKNYIKVALRNLARHRAFTIINITGLAFSISVCLLVITIIVDLKSYDKHHADSDRLYRVISTTYWKGDYDGHSAVAPLPLAAHLQENFSGIEATTRIRRRLHADVTYEKTLRPSRGIFADGNFFKLFNFKLQAGNISNAITEPFTVVISSQMKKDLFADQDAIGETINIGELGEFRITGVLSPAQYKSHLKFDMLASVASMPLLENDGKTPNEVENWNAFNNGFVYVKLSESSVLSSLQNYLNEVSSEKYDGNNMAGTTFRLQSVSDIYLGEQLSNQVVSTVPIQVVYTLAILAFLILITAAFNYTNLSTARALSRAKEIGIRKTTGAFRHQIFWQFITESIVVALISLLLAVGILQLLIPSLLQLDLLSFLALNFQPSPLLIFLFLLFALVTGLVAGFFPSLYLSSFSAIAILGNNTTTQRSFRWNWRKGLVIIQFIFSIVFITSALLTHKQFSHFLKYDYGFNHDNIVNVKLKDAPYELFRTSIIGNSDVVSVSGSAFIHGLDGSDGTRVKTPEMENTVRVSYLVVDEHYLETMDIKLVAGSNFSQEMAQSANSFIILNETATGALGWDNPAEAVGQPVEINGEVIQIIGVVKDFNFQNLFAPIRSMMLYYSPENIGYANVKISGSDPSGTVAYLEQAWSKLDPDHIFEFSFYEQQIRQSYGLIADLKVVTGFFSILAAAISGLGLFGMSIFITERKTKEIGVRKILGANTGQLFLSISRGTLIILLIAMVIALPLAILINSLWLNEIAYKVSVDASIIVPTILIMAGLAMLAMSKGVLNALRTNPVDSLRDE